MGRFAEVLGIRPWEWDHLAATEVLALIEYLDEQNKEAASSGD